VTKAFITSADKLASGGKIATKPSQHDFMTPLSCVGFEISSAIWL
jgi:hypothetical protein